MTVPRLVLLAAGWWLLLLAFYLVLVSHVTALEIAVGLGIALTTALVAAAAAGPFRPASPPRVLEWRRVWWLPVDMARDTAVLVAITLRRVVGRGGAPEGRVERRGLPPGEGREAAGVRAYAVLVLSASPGSYVLAVDSRDDDPDEVALHLVGPSGRAGRAVTR